MESLIYFLLSNVLWIKVIHIISIVSWMAGLLYLPRLFVYHSAELSQFKDPQSSTAKVFGVMEYRLYRVIMTPAMIFSLFTGVILAILLSTWSSIWMHLKLLGVLGLVVFHYLLNHWRLTLAEGISYHSEKFFRCVNEIPTLLLILIVICVVVKPF
jgi:protoporphyrinogen IX oxidase